jgi:hypothetical protein
MYIKAEGYHGLVRQVLLRISNGEAEDLPI